MISYWWAIGALIIAIITGVVGYTNPEGTVGMVTKIVAAIFLILGFIFLILMVLGFGT